MSGETGAIVLIVVLGLLALPVIVVGAAALMRRVARWIAGFIPTFGNSCLTVLVAGGLCWAGNAALAVGLMVMAPRLAAQIGSGPGQWIYLGIALVIDLAMTWLAVVLALRGPENRRPTHVQSLAIAAAFLVMAFALVFLCVGLLAGLFALL